MNLIHTVKQWLWCISLFSLCACVQDDYPAQEQSYLQPGEIALQWIPAKMGVYKSTPSGITRATDIKEQAEQRINCVHIFLFNNVGEYLKSNDGDVFQGYKYMNGNANWVLQSSFFTDQGMTGAANATIYAVANVPEGYFGKLTSEGYPENVPNMAALESMRYTPKEFSISIPDTGLPMVLKATGQNISEEAPNKLIPLKMRSMMARVDVSLRMVPDDPSEDGAYPSFKPTVITLHNLPKSGTIAPQIEDTKTVTSPTVEGEDGLMTEYIVSDAESALLNVEINEKRGTVEGTFYMFEHARLANMEGFTYPENISDTDKQRYKPNIAVEDATYLTLNGEYVNHNQYSYKVTYKLYLGGNPVNDFVIGTNRQYKNRITIKGITVNDASGNGHALLDTRVNIDREGNPYFIEMLRERKHDAHFNITPMDLYTDQGDKIEVSIRPFNEGDPIPSWIRMEAYKQAKPEVCDLEGEPQGSTFPTEKGKGKRYYFTEDLVTKDLVNNTNYTVTEEQERIYFYLDENLEPQERKAKIHLKYVGQDGTTSERDIEIRQKRLFKVYIDKFDNGKYIYLEQEEEYLNHFDPMDTYVDTVPGYIWGSKGKIDGIPDETPSFMQNGLSCTEAIIAEFKEETMTLNDTPRSAAEYCYNKNKRNNQGQVDAVNWYMPAIAELEYYLEKYYNDYPEFQNNFYWSSSPNYYGYKNDWDFSGARSTKVSLQNGQFTHVTSDAGQEGYKERNVRLRVRAARISWGQDANFPNGNE